MEESVDNIQLRVCTFNLLAPCYFRMVVISPFVLFFFFIYFFLDRIGDASLILKKYTPKDWSKPYNFYSKFQQTYFVFKNFGYKRIIMKSLGMPLLIIIIFIPQKDQYDFRI